MANEPIERQVFKRTVPERTVDDSEVDLSDARTVTPFQVILRGEDTVDANDRVTFSDFSPQVIPADTPEAPEPAPKALSVPVPAPSPDSIPQTAPVTSENPAPSDDPEVTKAAEELAAALEGGEPSENESGKPSSSSTTKSG